MSTKITQINLEDEMRKSYLDYAMSVIIGRALPDVRDGLKPVHRRVLYAMKVLGMTTQKHIKNQQELLVMLLVNIIHMVIVQYMKLSSEWPRIFH